MPKHSTHTAAQIIHKQAEAAGHDIMWQHSDGTSTATNVDEATGYIGRCSHPRCRICITVNDDDSDELTQATGPLPPCPLNSNLKR